MESLNLLENNDPNLLVLIIDTNTCAWQDHHKRHSTNDLKLNFENLVKSLAFLLQSYLLTHRDNRLVVISASDNGHSEVIYPTTSHNIVPTPSIFQSYFIEKLLLKSSKPNNPTTGHVKSSSTFSSLSSAFSNALCIINKQTIKSAKLQSQIIVTQVSSDDASTYNQIMNSIFSAHKLNVLIDSLVLSSTDSTFLQQASLITNGLYFKPHDQRTIPQLLLTHFLPNIAMRTKFISPVQKMVDFRAACSCHQEPVEFAYMCSVCLSITCESQVVCATCGSQSRR